MKYLKRYWSDSFFTQNIVNEPAIIQVDSSTAADLWYPMSVLWENIYYTRAFQNFFKIISSKQWGCSNVSDVVCEVGLECKKDKLFPCLCFSCIRKKILDSSWFHSHPQQQDDSPQQIYITINTVPKRCFFGYKWTLPMCIKIISKVLK